MAVKPRLFYDIEVFKYDALLVLKDINKKQVARFHNDFTGLDEFVRNYTLVGYNNYHYDDYILTTMLSFKKEDVVSACKILNDRIINAPRERPYKGALHKDIHSLDCFQQIDGMTGLKRVEANMERAILETDVPFDIDRPLTPDEVELTFIYCDYDVDVTIDVYKIRESTYFIPKSRLIARLPKEQWDKVYRYNTTTISTMLVLGDNKTTKWASLRLDAEGSLHNQKILDLVPPEVQEFWNNADPFEEKPKQKNVKIKLHGMTYEFSLGGLHGTNSDKQKKFHDVILLDVASLYPNLIRLLRALGISTSTFNNIVAERIAIKHIDQPMQSALKLVINSIYGLLKSKYNKLYNPYASLSVCVLGQALLFELCKRLDAIGCRLVQVNTDGVAFTNPNNADYQAVWEQWEKDFDLVLEEDMFTTFIQKDVNNYIGVSPDGHIKVKGGEVGRYENKENYYFKNTSLRIIDIALVNHLVYDKPVINTIRECLKDDKGAFQIILNGAGKTKGVFDDEGKQYQKINRVYATRHGGISLKKKNLRDGMVLFPRAPEKMYLWNDEIEKLNLQSVQLDINFYMELIDTALNRWK